MSGVAAMAGQPLTLRREIAGGMALAGMALGLIALGLGSLWTGLTGLLLMGLALGFTGGLRARLLVAALIWATTTALTAVGAAFGPIGFELTAPVVASLLFVALGQVAGLVAGVLVRSNGAGHQEGAGG